MYCNVATDDERRSEAMTAPPGPVEDSSLPQINSVDRLDSCNMMSKTSLSRSKISTGRWMICVALQEFTVAYGVSGENW